MRRQRCRGRRIRWTVFALLADSRLCTHLGRFLFACKRPYFYLRIWNGCRRWENTWIFSFGNVGTERCIPKEHNIICITRISAASVRCKRPPRIMEKICENIRQRILLLKNTICVCSRRKIRAKRRPMIFFDAWAGFVKMVSDNKPIRVVGSIYGCTRW